MAARDERLFDRATTRNEFLVLRERRDRWCGGLEPGAGRPGRVWAAVALPRTAIGVRAARTGRDARLTRTVAVIRAGPGRAVAIVGPGRAVAIVGAVRRPTTRPIPAGVVPIVARAIRTTIRSPAEPLSATLWRPAAGVTARSTVRWGAVRAVRRPAAATLSGTGTGTATRP